MRLMKEGLPVEPWPGAGVEAPRPAMTFADVEAGSLTAANVGKLVRVTDGEEIHQGRLSEVKTWIEDIYTHGGGYVDGPTWVELTMGRWESVVKVDSGALVRVEV